MTVLLLNSLTRKLRSCLHYGKKPKTPFFMMWRKRTMFLCHFLYFLLQRYNKKLRMRAE